ncbi:hypothetical protein [Neobacillus cucumis]|uniref:Uncharacterized protein n=1 Tax=Neobacillus cucumis TaxID=1740721 RepID=A0A2N5HP47_9BACI|nr:hypothetical protein [Neobacillus cucumis]PLS07247.1 hypothetical protein CVD27_06090 [Neobacillus cucumis]
MKGIYLVNDRISIDGRSLEESTLLQEQSIKEYIMKQDIQVVSLNPYQLKEYYTLPHALLYDLRKKESAFDCLIYYSPQTVEEFIYTYPAKWLILKSYFKEIILIHKMDNLNEQHAI